MYRIFFILLFIIPLAISAQQLKKVRHEDDKSIFTEVYYVLKSNDTVKEGPYKKFYKGDVVQTGFYKDNLKDSVWIEYDLISKYIFSRILYSKGKITGVVEYYNQQGELAQKYDYTNHQLIYNKPMSDQPIFNIADSAKQNDVAPVYIGGDWAIMMQVRNLMQYPKSARQNNIQGRVLIRFFVGVDGKASGYEIVRGVSPELDQEALRVVKLIQNHWIPGRAHGVPAPVYFNLPINFKLQ